MAGRSRHPPFRLVVVHLLLGLASLIPATTRAQPPPATVTVGLIIDADSPVGRIANTTIPMALDDFYAAFPNASTRVRVLQHDSGGDVVAAASAALQLMTAQGARAILGPQSSVESAFVADVATRAEVPVVSFSATSPSVSASAAPFFVRAALSDAAQAGALAALATYFGWRRVVPIYQDDDYGAAFVPFLVDALTAARAEVPYRCALPGGASKDAVAAAMYRLESEQTRAFVVHARPALAELVFAAAVEAGMMAEGNAWIITNGLTGLLGSINPPQGIIGLMPHEPATPRLRDVRKRWAQKFMRDHRDADLAQAEMGCYALWAYDAAWAVASAAERLGPGDLSSPPGLVGGKSGPTDFSGLGKSISGEKFLAAITNTTFDGLSGRFQLINGELAVPAFRVVNIMDNAKERNLGFWTSKDGLHRKLGGGASASNNSGLAPVIWPVESTVVPIGWVQPTSGRKLRVAVPGDVDPGYRAIMHLDVDPATNRTVAGGFVIEVFEAAVRLLPYALPFEYVLVGSMPYDRLVENVGNGDFDAAVADITITANRSQHVDFTLPYMSSGIAMVVPMRDQRSNRAWVFLKPLRYDLWLISFVFLIFTGFVVWAIEHRVNREFRGPASYQIGTLLYFGFSTLVFAHREDLKSNLTRFVVVVWVFVVLILQSSYTASLTSMLTVPQLEPTIGDYASLWLGTDKVGIMNDSFMRASMTKAGFPQSRLVPYSATQSFHEALLNGTIGAVVDETPYLRLFLKAYCGNFTETAQTNKTGGFGFAFPKGSPYVADLSRAILNLTESDEMSAIERKWFGDAEGCAAQGSPFTSDSLSFASFWGLFLVTGATSLLCCAVHLATFLVANRRRIRVVALTSDVHWKDRLRMFLQLFDDKDLSSHTFRTKDGGGSVAGRSANDAGASPAVAHIAAGSPLSASNHTRPSMKAGAAHRQLAVGNRSPARPSFRFLVVLLCLAGSERGEGQAAGGRRVVDVGVILDRTTWLGNVSWACMEMALEDFYADSGHANYRTRVRLHLRDTGPSAVDAASAGVDLLKNFRVQAIVGPQTSTQAKFLAELGNKASVPIISFSADSPSRSSSQTPYFIRTAWNDSSQAEAIASLVQKFNWREVVPVIEDDDTNTRFIPDLVDALGHVGTRVSHRFFRLAKDEGVMGQGFVWITAYDTVRLQDFKQRWHAKYKRENPGTKLNGPILSGLYAYDTVWALALASEKDWKLVSTTYKIINVVDQDRKEVGFWTPEFNISRSLKKKDDLYTIIWPGFCARVFEEVIHALPYEVPIYYKEFGDGKGESNGTYDSLIYKVYLNECAFSANCNTEFDAVVGDITILANRSLYVDFTLPYTESGQSYTASLSSILTVEQLQPTVTNLDEVIRRGDYVGYLNDSFMPGLLKRLKINDSKLIPFNSPEEYNDALSTGRVAVIVDEIPYLKYFLSKYCHNYTMVGPTYKFDGFGYAFPRGSPLTPEISRGILELASNGTMAELEKELYGDTICPDKDDSQTSSSLTLHSFLGLFIITGASSLLALILHAGITLYSNRSHLISAHSQGSWGGLLAILPKIFHEHDNSSNTPDKDEMGIPNVNPTAESTCSMSNHTMENFDLDTDMGSPLEGEGTPGREVSNQDPGPPSFAYMHSAG
ncbi:Glutamate receptor 2.8 [Dichanthelium oligosanthes]|uniref:Glutamate receptor 2.8 n=1 Tax=Dichanthelium oligosanthes TaxID=888268 RepID=A0A1E5VIC1_9POAL|nr:Glutamate receptor 2.8 [Dichanthelium oligosanthes]